MQAVGMKQVILQHKMLDNVTIEQFASTSVRIAEPALTPALDTWLAAATVTSHQHARAIISP